MLLVQFYCSQDYIFIYFFTFVLSCFQFFFLINKTTKNFDGMFEQKMIEFAKFRNISIKQ